SRDVVYNSNISLEKIVLEELIKGPEEGAAYGPTINPETKVISVSVKDGTCYVNFSEQFLKQPYTIKSDVTIYSIVNSLSELSNINKVQLSINGETNTTYLDSVTLTTVFERNLDIIE
ncbi:MAG: GerMN domain-containing protein, partial [Lachnospiraceae bacterium]|nr:GerMN domain-containing protein [Lachnospiraceae bacterium]